MKKLTLVLLCLGMFTLVGCGGKDEKKDDAKEEQTDAASQDMDQDAGKHTVAKPAVDEPVAEETPEAFESEPSTEENPLDAPQPEDPVVPAPFDAPAPVIDVPNLDEPAQTPKAEEDADVELGSDPETEEATEPASEESDSAEAEKEDIGDLFGEEESTKE